MKDNLKVLCAAGLACLCIAGIGTAAPASGVTGGTGGGTAAASGVDGSGAQSTDSSDAGSTAAQTGSSAAAGSTDSTSDTSRVISTGYGWEQTSDGRYRYKNSDGSYKSATTMAEKGNVYRFDDDGYMVTGWWSPDNGTSGKWQYYWEYGKGDHTTEGNLARSALVDGYWVDADGYYWVSTVNNIISWQDAARLNAAESTEPGWVDMPDGRKRYRNTEGYLVTNAELEIDGDTFRFDADGYMVTGWWSAKEAGTGTDATQYYYYEKDNESGRPEGAKARSTTIDDKRLDADGKYIEIAQDPQTAQAVAVLDKVGWNLKAAFNWSAGMTYHRFTADPDSGVNWFANYGFVNHYGNCYVMAATFLKMARVLGYEGRQMAGQVPSRKGGLTPHSWVELIIDGQTKVFDPDFTNNTNKSGFGFSYGTSGTWRYQSYYAMHD